MVQLIDYATKEEFKLKQSIYIKGKCQDNGARLSYAERIPSSEAYEIHHWKQARYAICGYSDVWIAQGREIHLNQTQFSLEQYIVPKPMLLQAQVALHNASGTMYRSYWG